jgi:fumarate hydratase subunit beta
MERRLKTPLTLQDIEALHAGDTVFLSGRIFTARDKAHALMRSLGCLPVDLSGAAIYHCGPLIKGDKVISAGPTTSGRMSRYSKEIVDRGVRAIIGKGGVPGEPLEGRCVYLAYPGGCGAAAAGQLEVKGVHLEELGMAEAMWEFEARDLGPLVVAIDLHGRDMYRDVKRSVQERLNSEHR